MSDPKPPEDSPGSSIIVSVDAMGGDAGPGAVIAGLAIALKYHPKIRYLIPIFKNKKNKFVYGIQLLVNI